MLVLSLASQKVGPRHERLLEPFVRTAPAKSWSRSAPDERLLEPFSGERLQPTPCHWCPLFAVWPELLEAVVDAVEEHLVVNVLALGQQVSVDSVLAELLVVDVIEVESSIWLLARLVSWVLSTLLSAFLQLEV